MKNSLWEEFFQSMMCFKKLESAFSLECEMQMNEMAILQDFWADAAAAKRPVTTWMCQRCKNSLRFPSQLFLIF